MTPVSPTALARLGDPGSGLLTRPYATTPSTPGAIFALVTASSAMFAVDTGNFLLTSFLAIFLAFFFVTGFALVLASSAIAVPARAATSARIETRIAAEGNLAPHRPSSLSGAELCGRYLGVFPTVPHPSSAIN